MMPSTVISSECSVSQIHAEMESKKRAKGDPAALQLTGEVSMTLEARRRLKPAKDPVTPMLFIGVKRPERP